MNDIISYWISGANFGVALILAAEGELVIALLNGFASSLNFYAASKGVGK